MIAAGKLETKPIDMEGKLGYPCLKNCPTTKNQRMPKKSKHRVEMGLSGSVLTLK